MAEGKITAGLRIDVDTFRGTREGVPALLRILEKHQLKASFFFSVGPDNMGRHLWRLLKPAFLIKMLRSKAASLYGWDILLRGTFWPGPLIGRRLADIIRQTKQAGHEVGFHAWDHHRWQMQMETMTDEQISDEIKRGVETLTAITGEPPLCSAAAGWKANEQVIRQKQSFAFRYNSDCRGHSIFTPEIDGKHYAPQIPVTLPTYDEVIGNKAITVENYNDYLLGLFQPEQLNVLTVHAEVEGIVCAEMFDQFLSLAKQRDIQFVPLQALLPADQNSIMPGKIISAALIGREGWVACQGE